jgi:ABC-type glycerol-3-phosphate transport system permease component
MMQKWGASLYRHGFLVFLAIASIYPVWFILQTSLKTNQQYLLDPLGIPLHPIFGNFSTTFSAFPVARWTLNSVIVSLFSVLGATLIALLASYAMVFGKMRGVQVLLNTNIALMVIPPVTLLIPMFILMVDLHLINTLLSVIIFYTGLFVPFSVFFLVNFMRSVPYELIEAAKIDGLSPFAILRRIVVPLSSAALFTLMLVNIIYAWNELLVALVFLQQQNSRTLMSGLALFQGRYSTNQPLVMAGAFVSVLPVLVLYIFGQRFFVKGMMAGIGK